MNKLFAGAIIASTSLIASDFETPTLGWSSWNTYRCNISDSLIMSQARAMVDLGLDSAGYRYINIDDGFQGGRDKATGRLLINLNRFPGGLKPVVDYIHSLGLKAGTYSDAGLNTCGNYWDRDTLSVEVGLYGHEDIDCQMFFNELGFDFIKVDYCGGDPEQNNQRLSLDPETQYRRIARAIRSTGRDDIRLNVCRWDYPGTWVDDVATSWRVTHDIWCGWESVRDIIAENLYLSAYARGGHYNDMDMLEVGRTLTPTEDRTHMAMWCMMSSPLLIGCDLTTLRPETLKLLANKELLAINQDSLGRQAHVLHADSNGGYILVKDLKKLYGNERAVAFYNPTDSVIVLKTTLEDLELTGPAPCRNATNQAYLGTVESWMSITLQPHETEVYTLTGKSRLMRHRYEAETARLGMYQELYNPHTVGTAYYTHDGRLSGGVGVALAGVTPNNDILWDDIYVPAEGDYELTVHYLPDRDAKHFYMSVNDGDGMRIDPAKEGESTTGAKLKCHLKSGLNSVRLFGTGRIPVIDLLEVK